jgi:outer membrane protein assembly factor BamD (BamD/ComL family)
MKNLKLILASSVVLFICSCGTTDSTDSKGAVKEPARDQYIAQIKKCEADMHTSTELNNTVAAAAIKAYSDYVMFFPNDSLSSDYLFKAAEIATATKQYQQALIDYQTITTKYPGFKLVQESLYLQGYLLDNFLNDDVKAKVIYEQVIAKYPTSNYANDAKAAINNLGKTDEQLIQEFKKKNGQK